MSTVIDTSPALNCLDELREMLENLNGERENLEANSKRVNSHKAEVNRRLLYAAHLAKVIEVEILSQYHVFKGEDPPLLG